MQKKKEFLLKDADDRIPGRRLAASRRRHRLDIDISYALVFIISTISLSLTQAIVEALTDPGQDSQRDEVTEAGSNGRGYVIRVDAGLL